MCITKTMRRDQKLRKQIKRVTLLISTGELMIMILFLGSSMMKNEKNNSRKIENKIRKSMERIVIKIYLLLMSIGKPTFLILQSLCPPLFKL